MDEIKIVRARPENAQILSEIAVAAKRYWNYPEDWIQSWLPILTITQEYITEFATWMAMMRDKPIGFYSLRLNGLEASLDNLWVLPEQIGKGIGRLLFTHAVKQSRSMKAAVLLIESDPNAVGFYEKMGARIVRENVGVVANQTRTLPVMEIKL